MDNERGSAQAATLSGESGPLHCCPAVDRLSHPRPLSAAMLAFNEAVLRSVKLSSPALQSSGSSGSDDDEEDGVIQPEQNRSHQLIESMLSSSPPQPTYSHHPHPSHHHQHHHSSSSNSPDGLSKPPSSSSSPASPRSPRSTDAIPTVAPGPRADAAQPAPAPVPTTAHLRPPSRPSDPQPTSSTSSSSSTAPTDPASPKPPIPRRKTAITEPLPPPRIDGLSSAQPREPSADPSPPLPPAVVPLAPAPQPAPPADGPARLAVDVAAAPTDTAAAAALASPTSLTRIVVSKSSTLSASMFSKEEVLSPPSLAGQSSLSKELTESGLFRPTRPYSASANSSPAAPYRAMRDARDGFASTGGLPSLDSFPPPAGPALALPSVLQKSASASTSPAPPPHRRTRSRGTTSSSASVLRVFPSVDQQPMQVMVPIHCPVQRVVELCLAQYKEEARQPPLRFDLADAYELRVLDDDDGTPDEDMPPLDRHRAIQEYGVDAVAFVEVADAGGMLAALSPSSAAQLKASAGQQAMEQKRGTGGGHPPPLQTVGSVSSPSSLSMSSSGSRWDEVLSPRSAALPYSTVPSPIPSHPPTPMAGARPPSSSPSSMSTRVKVSGGKVSLRVVLADMETHMLLVAADTRLEELLPLISRKKSSQMQPEHWKFLYPPPEEGEEFEVLQQPAPARPRSGSQQGHRSALSTSSQASVDSVLAAHAALQWRREHRSWQSAPELDMRLPVHQLEQDELRLLNKLDTPRRMLPSASINNHSATAGTSASSSSASPSSSSFSSLPHPDHFLWTVDTASAYSEYRVVKTNQRGKRQQRMFGIDRHKVYNKHVASAGHRRRISFEVTRAYRWIRSIHSITAHSTSFTISYHEKGGKLTQRQYETETRMECAEIVAKIRFLMQLAQQDAAQQGEGGAQGQPQTPGGGGGGVGALGGAGGVGGVALGGLVSVSSGGPLSSPTQ